MKDIQSIISCITMCIYMGVSMNSKPHCSTSHRVRREGPRTKNCFQFIGLTETSFPPSSMFTLQISHPSNSKQFLEQIKVLHFNFVNPVLLCCCFCTYQTTILKSGHPDRVTSFLPSLEKEKLVYFKQAPPIGYIYIYTHTLETNIFLWVRQ